MSLPLSTVPLFSLQCFLMRPGFSHLSPEKEIGSLIFFYLLFSSRSSPESPPPSGPWVKSLWSAIGNVACVASVSVLFGSRFISRAAKTENLVPRSFFAPKQKNGNACYAGYGKCDFNGLKFRDKRKEKLERYWLRQVYWLKLSYFHGLISFTALFLWQNLHVARRESHFVIARRPRRTATVPVVPAQWLGSLVDHNTEVTKIANSPLTYLQTHSAFVQPYIIVAHAHRLDKSAKQSILLFGDKTFDGS